MDRSACGTRAHIHLDKPLEGEPEGVRVTVPAVLGAEWLFLVFWLALALGVFALGGGPVGGGIVVGLFVLLWGGVTARLVHRGHTPRCAAISSLASITRLTEGF